MHDDRIKAINLHLEIVDLEIWLLQNPGAMDDDIIHVNMQIIRKRLELGILKSNIRKNELNSKTAETSR